MLRGARPGVGIDTGPRALSYAKNQQFVRAAFFYASNLTEDTKYKKCIYLQNIAW